PANTPFGTWFAVTSAVAGQVWPAVWRRTNPRATPAILARMVTTPRPTAAPASPLANPPRPPPTGAPGVAAGSSRPLTACSGVVARAAAELVEHPQRRCLLDHPGEAHHLAGRGQPDRAEQQTHPGPPGQSGRRGETEHGAERVRARVTEHGLLVEVDREQSDGGTDRRRGHVTRGARPRERGGGGQQHHLQRPTRPQVEPGDQ